MELLEAYSAGLRPMAGLGPIGGGVDPSSSMADDDKVDAGAVGVFTSVDVGWSVDGAEIGVGRGTSLE